MLPSGDDPSDFNRGAVLRAGERELEVLSARPYRDRGLLVAFVGVTDRNAAEELRGAVLTGEASGRRRLGEGEFWSSSLVGLEAVRPDGRVLGRVIEVIAGDFQDRLVVMTTSGNEVHVPFVQEFAGDPDEDRIVIDPPDGLFPG